MLCVCHPYVICLSSVCHLVVTILSSVCVDRCSYLLFIFSIDTATLKVPPFNLSLIANKQKGTGFIVHMLGTQYQLKTGRPFKHFLRELLSDGTLRMVNFETPQSEMHEVYRDRFGAVDNNNKMRQGMLSINESLHTTNWVVRVTGEILGVFATNVRLLLRPPPRPSVLHPSTDYRFNSLRVCVCCCCHRLSRVPRMPGRIPPFSF